MPTYDFVNTETGEIFEKFMGISESENYLKENPNIRKYFGSTSLNFIDEVMIGRKKPPSDWFHVLDKIKKNNPHHAMGNSRFEKPKEW